MRCESCGNENEMNNTFCTKCGSPLNNNQNNNQPNLTDMYNQPNLNQMYNQNNNNQQMNMNNNMNNNNMNGNINDNNMNMNNNGNMNNGMQMNFNNGQNNQQMNNNMNMNNNSNMNNSMQMNFNNGQNNNNQQMNMNNNMNMNNGMQMRMHNQNGHKKKQEKNNELFGVISIILGLSCIGIYFINPLIIFPAATVGIVLGKKAGKKWRFAMIANIVAIVITIILLGIAFYIIFNGGYKMYGTYRCADYEATSVYEDIKDFELKEKPVLIKLNYDNTFTFSDSTIDAEIFGKFELQEEKYSEMFDTYYYTIEMHSNRRVIGGEEYTDPIKNTYGFAIYKNNKGKQSAYIYNPRTMSQYVCERSAF